MAFSKFRTVEYDHHHTSYLFRPVIGHISSYPIGFIFGTDILQGIPWGQMFGFLKFQFFFSSFETWKLRNFEHRFNTLLAVRLASNFVHTFTRAFPGNNFIIF